jgi:hypothetical protein
VEHGPLCHDSVQAKSIATSGLKIISGGFGACKARMQAALRREPGFHFPRPCRK